MKNNTEVLSELAILKKQIRILTDKEEIRDILARYSYLFDMGFLDKWYDVWADEGVYISNNPRTGEVQTTNGKTKIMEQFGQTREYGAMQHLQLQLVIEVDGDNASAIGYQEMFNGKEKEPKFIKAGLRTWRLKRINGKWLITEGVSRVQADEAACKKMVTNAFK